uniref:ParB/Srx family N-terminal domain-containing protein n=1 Tax=Pseudoalteromonas sp. (strain SANK 73390) TaxID=747457 RepID=UPI00021172A1|nr:ParB/Srx family N-terminal domain-containing protein [Pseudoalteromonas sp. SANK 73390]CBK62741.1 tmuA [Pseudoalteromonas sp. SANK 73390]
MISLEQKVISFLGQNKEVSFKDEEFSYDAIFLSNIKPDPTNARYLPAVMLTDEDASLFVNRKISKRELVKMYDAEGFVLVGKNCFINCLTHGTPEWKKTNNTIHSIVDLANNLAMSEIIQAPTVYPLQSGKFQILTGHRRYFALVYTNGIDSVSQFKVYQREPILLKTKQFQENASREDLPQYGKLVAFNAALLELQTLSDARLRLGLKKLTVRETVSILGISMGSFDNYKVLTRYSCVLKAYENGIVLPFIHVKKIVLEIEEKYKKENDKSVLNVTDKRYINKEIDEALNEKPRKNNTAKSEFKFKKISSANTIKTLFESNIFQLDTGIDWSELDWGKTSDVNAALAKVIDYLESHDDQ